MGRVAVLAPSGMSAANAGAYKFHDGLTTFPITYETIRSELSAGLLDRLARDFAQVVCVVIEEFSMVSLELLCYLDKILRAIRPAFSEVMFGGVPIIILGDTFQLPVVHGQGLLNNPEMVDKCYRAVFDHCTRKCFLPILDESVRHEGDGSLRDCLFRVRLAIATEEDAILLNSRVSCITKLEEQDERWASAPVLTATNVKAESYNTAATPRNGNKKGILEFHAIPMKLLGSRKKWGGSIDSKREKRIRAFYKSRKAIQKPAGTAKSRVWQKSFRIQSVTHLYPRQPVMLRVNTCPPLGLCNGAIGKVVGLYDRGTISSRETMECLITRIRRDLNSGRPEVPSLLLDLGSSYTGVRSAVKTRYQAAPLIGSNVVLIEPVLMDGVYGLPVSIAHSMSMHKSQSPTLERVIIDPKGTFCMGGLYVALSRCPSLENMALLSLVNVEMLNKFHKQVEKVQQRLRNMGSSIFDMRDFSETLGDDNENFQEY